MKTYTYDWGEIVDLGAKSPLIVIKGVLRPVGDNVPQFLEKFGWGYEWYECGKPRPCHTMAGRPMLEIVPGAGWYIHRGGYWGDRSWDNWRSRRPAPPGIGLAAATSHGGGNWFEVLIIPAGGCQRVDEHEAEQEVLGAAPAASEDPSE